MAVQSSLRSCEGLKLCWRKTFIDVDAEEAAAAPGLLDGNSRRRCASAPASSKRAPPAEHQELFGGEQAYVEGLSKRMSQMEAVASACLKVSKAAGSPSVASTRSAAETIESLDDWTSASTAGGRAQAARAHVQNRGVVCEIARLLQDEAFASQQHLGTNELVAHSLLRAKVHAETEGEVSEVVGVAMNPTATWSSQDTAEVHCNPGSVGHPELCMRPCIYFATGHCANGSKCEYCHMGHPKRPVHLDKRHRELLRGMTLQETASLMLPVAREKVESLSASAVASAMLDELYGCAGVSPWLREPTAVNRHQRMLVLTLKSMSLRSLLTTFGRMFVEPCQEADVLIERILKQVRADVSEDGPRRQ